MVKGISEGVLNPSFMTINLWGEKTEALAVFP
jgi:hypothetical protein